MVTSEKPADEGNHVKKISGNVTFKGEMVGKEQKKQNIYSRKEIKETRRQQVTATAGSSGR